MLCTPHQISFGDHVKTDGQDMWHVRGREVHTGLQWGKLREGDHLEDPGIDGRIILKWILERLGGGAQNGLIWLRIGTGGGLLCIR
jgi:hypothetical protein